MTPGSLIVTIDDRTVDVAMVDGQSWSVPVGPLTLVERELERSDRPAPEQLTNALGLVSDHLDDIVRESPKVLSTSGVTVMGEHAEALAKIELGSDSVPAGYTIGRADADEVFRTLVAEGIDERRHNPGLERDHVESIIGTCCIVLAVMRRLELTTVAISARSVDEQSD